MQVSPTCQSSKWPRKVRSTHPHPYYCAIVQLELNLAQNNDAWNSIGNIPWYGTVKTHIIACGVVKTTPNNHPSHVGCDTSAQVCDTSAVDLENSYWNSMGRKALKTHISFYSYKQIIHKHGIHFVNSKLFKAGHLREEIERDGEIDRVRQTETEKITASNNNFIIIHLLQCNTAFWIAWNILLSIMLNIYRLRST